MSDELRARHLEPPSDEREIARHYTLGAEDLAQVAARRGDANRLGYALVVSYLRFPGRVLEVSEVPPDAMLAYVAHQLGVPASAFGAYAHRAATRRAHLTSHAHGRLFVVGSPGRACGGHLPDGGRPDDRPSWSACRHPRRGTAPTARVSSVALVLEAVIRGARRRAERLGHEVLTIGLDEAALGRLDALLDPRATGRLTWLGWLRTAPSRIAGCTYRPA